MAALHGLPGLQLLELVSWTWQPLLQASICSGSVEPAGWPGLYLPAYISSYWCCWLEDLFVHDPLTHCPRQFCRRNDPHLVCATFRLVLCTAHSSEDSGSAGWGVTRQDPCGSLPGSHSTPSCLPPTLSKTAGTFSEVTDSTAIVQSPLGGWGRRIRYGC